MLDRAGLEFSFSGLKTAVSLAVRDRAAAAANGALTSRRAPTSPPACRRPSSIRWSPRRCARVEDTGYQAVVVAGGVGANLALRSRLDAAAARQGAKVYYPRIEFCTDNAAMIAVAGLARLKAGKHESAAIRARATWSLEDWAEAAWQCELVRRRNFDQWRVTR